MNRRRAGTVGLAVPVTLAALSLAALSFGEPLARSQAPAAAPAPQYFSVKFEDVKWEKMFPEWGADSPEIAILRVDPKTQATQLLIRNPKAMHVPRHWHTANETHTVLRGTFVFECDGKKEVLGPGSFNYIPSKMIHQAWLPDDGLAFITVDAAWDVNWVEGPPGPDVIGRILTE